jgi:malonate transporter
MLDCLLPIIFITLLGKLVKITFLKSEEFWRGIESLAYFVLFPLAIINFSLDLKADTKVVHKLVSVLMLSSLFLSLILMVYNAYRPFTNEKFTSIFQGGIRYNSYTFIGIGSSICLSDKSMHSVIAMISAYMIIFTNILSVIIFNIYIKGSEKKILSTIKSIVINPIIVASILSMFITKSSMPNTVVKSISSLAGAAMPLGFMIMGSRIKLNANAGNINEIITATVAKLLIMPLITISFLYLFNVGGDEGSSIKKIGILFSCLPCSNTSYLLSRKLKGDHELMSSIITFSIIFGYIAIPLFVHV